MNGPNALGRDRFEFNIISEEFIKNHPGAKPLDTYYTYRESSIYQTRDGLIKSCKSSGWTCLGLIMMDGWEIRNDYPYRI